MALSMMVRVVRPKEVHFQQAEFFEARHVVLGDDFLSYW